MKISFLGYLLTFSVFLSSCATFYLPRYQTVDFYTNNDSTTIFVNQDSIGTGSHLKKKVKRGQPQQVTVRCPGHKDQAEVLQPNHYSTGFWLLQPLNLPFTFFGFLYDFTFDKNVSFPEEQNYNVNGSLLQFREDSTEKNLTLNQVALYSDNKSSASISIHAKYPKNPKDLDDVLAEARSKHFARLKPSEKDAIKTNDSNDSYSASLISDYRYNELLNMLHETGYLPEQKEIFHDNINMLELTIRFDYAEEYAIEGQRWSQHCEKTYLRVTWFLANLYGEMIDSIQTEAWSGNFAVSREFMSRNSFTTSMYGDALYNNFLELQKTETFKHHIKKEQLLAFDEPWLQLTKPVNAMTKKADGLKASVTVVTPNGHGSGFAVTEDGYLITNYHVIASNSSDSFSNIEVINHQGDKMKATVVRYNKQQDLALLKVDSTFEFAFVFSDSAEDATMNSVYTIGTPSSVQLVQTISLGLVSGYKNFHGIRLMQLSMTVNPGNSGGPTFGDDLKLNGVIVSKLSGGDVNGICFAIPTENLKTFLKIDYSK